MQDYALIAGCDEDATELYLELARAEGMDGVVAHDAEEAVAIVTERGAPRLFMVDLGLARDGGLATLRKVNGALRANERPSVLAMVAPELVTTVGDLNDALGVSEILPRSAGEQVVRTAIRRTLAKEVSGRYPIVAAAERDSTSLRRAERK
jgi:DNA-binding response OmpR family regulator